VRSWLIFEISRAYFSLFRSELVSCGFHGSRVKETSDSCFDSFIESGAWSIIDLHMLFVCTDVPDESQGSFRCFGNWVTLMVSAGLTFAKASRIRDLCLSDRPVA